MKNIFLIDDDPIYVFLLRKIITSADAHSRIFNFSDGLEAISVLTMTSPSSRLLPDIIFLDLSMPVMDGWGFLNEFIPLYPKLHKKINLYIVSSSITPSEIERSKKYKEVLDYLIKPVDREKIIEIIQS